jgi:hypothetical protein
MSDEVADRLNEVIKRFQTIREPLRRNRKLRRQAFLDTLLDGLKARTEAKTNPRSEVVSVEEVIEENERLKAQLKKKKEEEELFGRRHDIAIEI